MSVLVAQSPVRCRKRATTFDFIFIFFWGFQRLDFSLDFKPFFQLKRISLVFLLRPYQLQLFCRKKLQLNAIISWNSRYTLSVSVTWRTEQRNQIAPRRGRKKQGNAPREGGNQQICKWMPSDAADCSARSVQCVISITNQSLGDFLLFLRKMCYLSLLSWLVLN